MSHKDTNNKRTKRKHNAERRNQSKKLQNHYNMYGGDITAIELGKVKKTEKDFITTIDGAKAEYQAYMKDKTRYDLIKQTLEDLTLDDDKDARIFGEKRYALIDTPASNLKRVGKKLSSGDKFTYYFERVSNKAVALEDDLADSLIKIANYKLFSKNNKINKYKYELKISDLEARIEPLRLIIQQLKEINDFIVAKKNEASPTSSAKIQQRLRWLKIGNKDFYGLKNDAATPVVGVADGGAGAEGRSLKTNLDDLQTQCNTKLTAFGGKLNNFVNIANILKDAQGYLNDKTITNNVKQTEIKKYYEMVWTIVSLGYYDKGDKGFNWGEYIQNRGPEATWLKAIKQAMPTSLASNVDIKAKNFEKLYATMHLIYYGVDTQTDFALTNYGATFDSIKDINPIAAVVGPPASAGMDGKTIVSITSLTDKKFVLGLTDNRVGLLELNADGTVKSSNLCLNTAGAAEFARQQIARLDSNTFVVGYTAEGSFSVIDANTRTMLPFGTTALAGVTIPANFVTLAQNKLNDAATANTDTTNADAAAAITTTIVADKLITDINGYGAGTFNPALTAKITALLNAVPPAVPALAGAAAVKENIAQLNNDAGWQSIAKAIITTAITENLKSAITTNPGADEVADYAAGGNVINLATAITTTIMPIASKLIGFPATDANIRAAILAQIKTMIATTAGNVDARLTAIAGAPASLLAIANTFFATPLVRAVTQGMCDVIYGNVVRVNDATRQAAVNDAQNEVDTATPLFTNARNAVNLAQTAVTDKQGEFDVAQNAVNPAQTAVTDKQVEFDVAQTAVTNKQAEIAVAQNAVNENARIIQEAIDAGQEANRLTASAETPGLNNALAARQNELGPLQATLATRQNELAALQAILGPLQATLATRQNELAALQAILAPLRDTLATRQNELNAANNKLDAARALLPAVDAAAAATSITNDVLGEGNGNAKFAINSDPALKGNIVAIRERVQAFIEPLITGAAGGDIPAKLIAFNTTANYDAIAETISKTPLKLATNHPILSIKCFTALVGIDGVSTDCVCIHQTNTTGFLFYKTDGTPLTFRATRTAHPLTANSVFDITSDGTKIAVFEPAAEILYLCDIDYTSKVMTWQPNVNPYSYFGAAAFLPGALDYITSISYSPDGSTLAVGLNRPGEYTVACTAQGNDSTQLSLNVKIDMPKANANIVVYNSGSKEELFRASAPGGSANNVRFSPDGSLIAAVVDNAANYSKYYNLSGVIIATKVQLSADGAGAVNAGGPDFKAALAAMLNANASLKMIFNKRRNQDSDAVIEAATFTANDEGQQNIEHLANTPMFLQYLFQPLNNNLVLTVIRRFFRAIGQAYFLLRPSEVGQLNPPGTGRSNISRDDCAARGTDLIRNGEADFKLLYKDLTANEAEWNSTTGLTSTNLIQNRYSDSTITKITQLTWCYGGYIAVRLGEIGYRNVQLFDASDGFYNNSFLTENRAQMVTLADSANLIAFGNTDDSLQIISTNGAATPNQLHLRKWDVQYTQLLQAYNKLTTSPVSAEVFSDFYNDFQTSLNYFTFQKDFFQDAPTANGNPTGIEYIAMQTIIDDVVKSDPSYDTAFNNTTKVEKVFEEQLTAYVGQLYDDNGDGTTNGLNINRNPFKQLYTLNQYDNYNFMVSSQRRIVLNTKMLGPPVLKLDINNFPVVSNEVIQYEGEYYRDYVDYKMSIGKEKSFKYTPHGFGKILYLRNKENPEDDQDTSSKGFYRNGLLFGYADQAYGDISYENNTDAVAYIYRGYWKNDKKYGSGVEYDGKSPSTNKIKFIGNFVDGQRYGNGIEFSKDFDWKDPEKRTGTVYYGYWVNGQFGWANDIYSQRTSVTIYDYNNGRMESKYVGEIRQNEDGKILAQGKGVKTTYGYADAAATKPNKETVDAGTFFEGHLSGTEKDNTIRTVKELDAASGATTSTTTQKGTFVKGQPVNIKESLNGAPEEDKVAELDAYGKLPINSDTGKPTGALTAAPTTIADKDKFAAFEAQKTKELEEDQADLQTFNNRDIDKLQGKSVPIVKTNSERRVEIEKQKATDKGRILALDDKMKDREKVLAVSQAVSQGKYVKIDNSKATAGTDFGIIIFANKNKYIGPIIDNGNTLLISTMKGRLENEGGDVLIASDSEGKNESAWSKYVLSADIGKYKDPSKLPQPWVSFRPYDIFSIIPKNSAVSAVFAQQEVSNAIMNTSAAGKTFISDGPTLEKMRGIIYRDIVIYVQAYILVIRSILGNNGPKTDANGDPVDSCGRPMLMGGDASQMGSDQLVDAGVGQYIDLNLLQQTGGSGIEGTSLMMDEEKTNFIVQVGGGEVEDLEVAYQAYIRQLSVLTGAINSSITTIGNKTGFEPLKRTLESYASKYDTVIKQIEENISQIKEAQRKPGYDAGASKVAGLQPILKYKFPKKTNTSGEIDNLTADLKTLIDSKNAIKTGGPPDKAEYDAFLNRTSIDASQLEMLKTTYISGATDDKTLYILDLDYYPISNPALKRKDLGTATAAAGVRSEVAGKLKPAYEALNTAIDAEMNNVNGEVAVVTAEIVKFNPPSVNYDPKWLDPLNNVKSKLSDYNGKLNELKGKIEASITAIAAKPLSYSQLNEYYREYSNIFGTAFAQVDQAINDLYSTISPALSGQPSLKTGAESVNTNVIKELKKKNLDNILTKMTGQYGSITTALTEEFAEVKTNGIDKVSSMAGAINAGFAPVWLDDLTALQKLLTEYQTAFAAMNTEFSTKYPPDGTDYVSLVAFLKTNETTFGTYNKRRLTAIDKLKSDMMLIDPGTKAIYAGKLNDLMTKLKNDTTILDTNIKPPALPREIDKTLGTVTVSKPGESIVDISSIFKTIFNYLNNPKSGNKDTVVLAFEKYKKMIETDKKNEKLDENFDEVLFTELDNIDSTYADYFHAEINYLEIKDDANVPSKEKQDKKAILDKFTTINTRTKSVLDQLAAVYVNIKNGKSDANVKITISDIAKTIAPIKEGEFETYLTDIDLSLTGPNSGYSRFLGEFPDQIKDLQSFPNQTSNFVKEILNAIIMSVSKNTGNLLDGNSQQLDKFDKNQVLLIINKNIIILFNMYLIIISKLPITDPFLVLNLYNGFGVAYEKTYELIQRKNESNLDGFEKNKEEIFENSDTNDFIKSILMAIAVSVAAGGVAAAASGIFTASGGKKYTRRRKVVKRKYKTKRHRKLNLKGRKYVTRKVMKKRRKGKGKK